MAVFPDDLKFMWSANLEKTALNSKETAYSLYAVRIPESGKALVGGKDIKNASKGLDQNSGAITVDLTMTVEGSDQMGTNDYCKCWEICCNYHGRCSLFFPKSK
jgi:SecD/SecF fusion protein